MPRNARLNYRGAPSHTHHMRASRGKQYIRWLAGISFLINHGEIQIGRGKGLEEERRRAPLVFYLASGRERRDPSRGKVTIVPPRPARVMIHRPPPPQPTPVSMHSPTKRTTGVWSTNHSQKLSLLGYFFLKSCHIYYFFLNKKFHWQCFINNRELNNCILF